MKAPYGERPRSFFIRKLLEIADSDDRRLLQIRVTKLSDAQVAASFPNFNPDYTLEEAGDIVLPHVVGGLEWDEHRAAKGNDLSHNGVTRYMVKTGQTEYMKEETPAYPGAIRLRTRMYRRRLTERVAGRIEDEGDFGEQLRSIVEEAIAMDDQ